MDRIPLVDLAAQYRSIKAEMDGAIHGVLERAAFIGGADVRGFEEEFARYARVGHCAGVGNGTDALALSLRALGVGPGDEVLVPAMGFIATAEAVNAVGATPVFVDVTEETLQLDPARCRAAITPRTRAMLPVHLYGHPADMDALLEVARAHDLHVVEDVAQAHGATLHGRTVGTFGALACFSFYPGKNLGAYGDAGAVTGSDPALIQRIRMLANHGRTEKYLHQFVGTNSRLDALQAAILRVKLRHLDAWTAARRAWAARYLQELSGLPITLPRPARGADPVWHLFVIRSPRRDAIREHLGAGGIETGIHYPTPLHHQPAYRHSSSAPPALPVCEQAAREVLSLPLYPELTEPQFARVVDVVRNASRQA